jgi:alkanesulfonate monooxygenase SsuD/methylene tetrahydromethanopterin reductase-like flavin-dependent oxidoreductase (luciferase family)
MKIAVTIEGMCGLNWPRWKRFVSAVEELGFAGLFRSDHFTLPDPPEVDSLEMIVSLTYLASHSQRVHFGPLVAPLSFRDPIMLARQAMALDDLSGGRMILGLGAGWILREHTMFGYNLGDVKTRMDRLEEGVEVIARLIRSEKPVTFEGRFHHLQEAQLLPRPPRPTRIMIGGNGPKRTLPLVARYADIWNCQVSSPVEFKAGSTKLDELLAAEGRQPGDVKRTVMVPAICWLGPDELETRMNYLRAGFGYAAGRTTEEIFTFFRSMSAALGSPEVIIETLSAYAAAGVEELIMQWFSMDDVEGLERIAQHVLPHFASL